MPSTKPPPLSSAAASSPAGEAIDADPAERILAAGAYLDARGVFGLLWCDEKLIVRASDGALASFVPVGALLTTSVLPLYGLDDQIRALQRWPDRTVDVPNVSIVSASGPSARLNLTLFWLRPRKRYLVLISRALSRSDLEGELSNQIRARMIAEQELVDRSKEIARANAELTRVNRDLSEFAYIISHDLQAPLRAMRYFAEDLERSLADSAAGEPRVHLERIKLQSRRMSQMMGDLLAYSRVGRKEEAVETVDTARLIASVVASISRPAGLDIETTGTFPVIETLAAPLDLVLRNLIENAIKHHDRGTGLVRVSARRRKDALVIEVADDGRGIDPAHHETIFQPFRRLAEDDGGGSGIGLALVRRAIEQVGGQIEVHSSPATSRGTTFRFSWPLHIEPAAGAR
jgi:signal transduction histidine kinase